MPEKELAFHAGSSQIEPASGQVYTDFAREQLGKVYTSPKSSPNYCTIGVEMCHPDWGGEPTPATRQALIELFADICIRNNLDPMSQITTHHAIVGWKDCPRFFTNHPDEFIAFKTAVRSEVYRRK
jgi:N-acetylmuramoyl-L-alanine amidase